MLWGGISFLTCTTRHVYWSLFSLKGTELEERGNFVSVYSFGKHESTEVRAERASRDIEHNDLLFSQGNQLALCGRRCHYQRLGEKALAAEEWFWLRAETDYQVCFYISLYDLKLWVNTLLVKCLPGQWGVIHWEAGKKNKKLQVLCYSTQYKTMLPLQVQSSSKSGF